MLYKAKFWDDGKMKTTDNFEFDSRCPGSVYIKDIQDVLDKTENANSLLSQPDCTWAFLGDGRKTDSWNRYFCWTSLNTDKVGANVQIPVIVQTSSGKFYIAETTTDKRTKTTTPNKGDTYVTISKHLLPSEYKGALTSGKQYSSLEDAYDAYLTALEKPEYAEAVKRSQSSTP